MSKYPVMVYDKHGKGYGTIDFNNAMFCLRKKIASERDYLGKDVVGITIIAILPTCICKTSSPPGIRNIRTWR